MRLWVRVLKSLAAQQLLGLGPVFTAAAPLPAFLQRDESICRSLGCYVQPGFAQPIQRPLQ